MKDQRIYLKIEATKKEDFLRAMEKMKTTPTRYLTYQIDEAIKASKSKHRHDLQTVRDYFTK